MMISHKKAILGFIFAPLAAQPLFIAAMPHRVLSSTIIALILSYAGSTIVGIPFYVYSLKRNKVKFVNYLRFSFFSGFIFFFELKILLDIVYIVVVAGNYLLYGEHTTGTQMAEILSKFTISSVLRLGLYSSGFAISIGIAFWFIARPDQNIITTNNSR